MKPGRLFRLEEVAALRSESYRATRAAVARGEIRTVRVGARGVRVTEAEVLRLQGETVKSSQPANPLRPTDPSRPAGAS